MLTKKFDGMVSKSNDVATNQQWVLRLFHFHADALAILHLPSRKLFKIWKKKEIGISQENLVFDWICFLNLKSLSIHASSSSKNGWSNGTYHKLIEYSVSEKSVVI